MLYRSHMTAALDARREEFVVFERTLRDEVGDAATRLRALSGKTSGEIFAEAGAHASRVTFASAELDAHGGVAVPFGVRWHSHEEARGWSLGVLESRVTFAADGSQLYPGRDISLPVGAVQVASFENPHTPEGLYTKDAHFEVIPPSELLKGDRQYESPEQVVSIKRFELEARTVCGFLERQKGWRGRGERLPLAFFDGSLLMSSARQQAETWFSKLYAEALIKLVALSRETEVPVVGYIDHSYAPDLRDLLEALDAGMPRTSVYDAQMLRAPAGASAVSAPLLGAWGDRTIFWHCQRTNLSEKFYDAGGRPLVGFVYMQTTGDGAPSRLDIPAWVYEAGLLEELTDAVRAECVVGNGYPYALETADEAAVITARDRAQFLREMQSFAEQNQIAFRVSRKAVSKGRRR